MPIYIYSDFITINVWDFGFLEGPLMKTTVLASLECFKNNNKKMKSQEIDIVYITPNKERAINFSNKCDTFGISSLTVNEDPSVVWLSVFLSRQKTDLSSYLIIIDMEVEDFDFFSKIHPLIAEYPEVTFWFEGTPEVLYSKLFKIGYEADIKLYEKEASTNEAIEFLRDFLKENVIREPYNGISKIIKKIFFDGDEDDIYNGTSESNDYLLELYSDLRRYLVRKDLVPQLLCISSIDDISSSVLLRVGNNVFDAANLRYVIKQWKLIQLNCAKNYKKIECSRRNNIAICVEEESSQCYYNCYVFFANGYRSLPVTSATFLRNIRDIEFKGERTIVRDFDLQFTDEKQVSKDVNEVDKIRGYKFDSGVWLDYIDDKSEYWRIEDYRNNDVYFVTYGYDGLVVEHNRKNLQIHESKTTLCVPGMTKPIIGILTPLSKYMKTLYVKTSTMRYNVFEDDYIMDLSRENHQHGAPLDLYDMALSMIKRAEYYLKECNYLLSAIISQEVVEMLNGFHKALSLQAYYIHVKAENSLAIDVLGGDDKILAEDAILRIKRIEEDIDRVLAEKDFKASSLEKKKIRKATRLNVLNQIFSDCRTFCKEKEHFKAEDVFISEMAHINDGFSLTSLIKK